MAASFDLLVSAVTAGDLKVAKFILERLDVELMRPKDKLLLKGIEEHEKAQEQIKRTGDLLHQLSYNREPES